MRAMIAFTLSFVLALSGAVLASAKGASHDVGMEIVICSGVGMTTITVGPDGQPVETKEVCPDGYSTLGATFTVPDLPRPTLRLVAEAMVDAVTLSTPRHDVTPSARGPPVPV